MPLSMNAPNRRRSSVKASLTLTHGRTSSSRATNRRSPQLGALLPDAPPIERAASPGPALAALPREALLARIAQLTPQRASAAGLRYRDLGEQSDDDLRQFVAALERTTTHEP